MAFIVSNTFVPLNTSSSVSHRSVCHRHPSTDIFRASLQTPGVDLSLLKIIVAKISTVTLASLLTLTPMATNFFPLDQSLLAASDTTTFKVPGGSASTRQSGAKKTLTRGVELIGADFSEGEYEGVSFQQSNLRKANFEGAKLVNASFFDSDLAGVNFKGANLSGANLELANMRSADVTDAVLAGKLFILQSNSKR